MKVKKDYDNLEQTLVLKTVLAYERLYYTGRMNGEDEYELMKDQFYTLKGILNALYDVPDTGIIWRAIASFYKTGDYDHQRPAELFYRHVIRAFELWEEFEREEGRRMKKLTCYACDGDFTEGVWIDRGEWTFYCPECYQRYEKIFPSWEYAEKRYLTRGNNTDEHWGECFWCNTISHDSIIECDDNGEEICPECKRAGAMLKV